jgi:hypothetical protein
MANMDYMDRLLSTVRVRLPGATQAATNLELFNTIDEFFRQTNAWRYESTFALVESEIQYPIFPPAGSDMVQVLGVEHRGMAVAPSTDTGEGSVVRQRGRIIGFPDANSDTLFEPDVTSAPGGVFQYSIFFPAYLEIDIPPSADATQFPMSMLLSLTLNYQCLEDEPNEWPLQEWMHATFGEAWIEGVQARMMSQINKPYSNPTMATYHAKRFRKLMGRAKQTASRGYVYSKPNWRFPGFAAQR